MKRTTGGDAPPVNGERFGQGSNLFRSVDEALQEAVPNDSWDGSGSDAYADQNTRQQVRSETVSDADGEVAKVLYREAGQIKLCRSVLDDYHNFLAEVGEYTFYLQFVPRYGEAAKMAIELATVNTALTDCTWQLHQLNSAVNQNAAALQLAVGRYAAVADGAVLTITDFGGPPPGSGSPPLPPIERSQPRPDTPPSAPSAPADGASPRNAPPPSALPAPPPAAGGGVGPSGGGGPSAGPPDTAPPVTPDLPPMPSVPETPGMGSPSGAAPGSGGASPLGSLMGPLGRLLTGAPQAAGQRAASTGQPVCPQASAVTDKNTKDKAAPAEAVEDEKKAEGQEAEESTDDSNAGTAAGVGSAERAPIHIEVDVDPDRLDAPVTVTLDPDNPAVPPAATTPSESIKRERG